MTMAALLAVAPLSLVPNAYANEFQASFETPVLLTNECAVFYTENEATDGSLIASLEYGELIEFNTRVSINSVLDISDSGQVNFKFHTQAHGSGDGATSGIRYQFNLNSMYSVKSDVVNYDPTVTTYAVKARINGQGQDLDGDGIFTGASNNAELNFKVKIAFYNGTLSTEAFDWSIECANSPWSNLMENRVAGTREEVGDGFGDFWNKYAWSMEDFNGGLFVGTKNMFYSIEGLLAAVTAPISTPLGQCVNSGVVLFPYSLFGCLELFGDIPGQVSSRGSEIWRLDYNNKRWERVFDAADPTEVPNGTPKEFDKAPQGFRDMVVHQGKLYVASDLGAFISGVALDRTIPFTYPGVDLLVSEDGYAFAQVPGCVDDELCEKSEVVFPPGLPTNNGSIRALASVGDRLFIGTFNAAGGEVWSYEEGVGFDMVFKAPLWLPIVAEINEYEGKLYIGMGGQLITQSLGSNNYVYACDLSSGCDEQSDFAPPSDLLNIHPGTAFVIKQFVAKDKLFVGTVNFDVGFSLLSYDGTDWEIIVDGEEEGGFFNDSNAYLWSAAVVGDRIFVGTWNYFFIDQLPRGDGELWYSDDGVNWTEYPLPLDWEFPNYGIRSMVYANRQLFLGSASLGAVTNLDLPDKLRPATQIWSIRDTKVNQPGNN